MCTLVGPCPFFLERLLDVISTFEGRSKAVHPFFYYAGHGGLNANGHVIFYARARNARSFGYIKKIEQTLLDPSYLTEPKLERTKIVIILDSCFSGNVIRATPSMERAVAVITGVRQPPRLS